MGDDRSSGARLLSTETGRINVLIVADNATGFSSLSRRLEARGCQCSYAGSYSEGARFFAERGFDVVLCADVGEGMGVLVAPLIGSTASLFRAHAVEDSCWWLPTVRHGRKCLGIPAFRPTEFAIALERIVEEIRSSTGPPSTLAALEPEMTLS